MVMDDRRYYDFQWRQTGGEKHPYIAEKTKIILDIMPRDVRAIIDVGCGDGSITNVLAESYTVIGGDISQEGLKYLSAKAQPIVSSASCLPFKDGCAELVLSSELLEHLRDSVFLRTISEIKLSLSFTYADLNYLIQLIIGLAGSGGLLLIIWYFCRRDTLSEVWALTEGMLGRY